MPIAAPTACKYIGCKELGIKEGWCLKHHVPKWKMYDKQHDMFYNTKEWKNIRREVLSKERLCRMCKSNDIIRLATVVDHIIPRKKGGSDFDTNNLQPLCEPCHNYKRSQER